MSDLDAFVQFELMLASRQVSFDEETIRILQAGWGKLFSEPQSAEQPPAP